MEKRKRQEGPEGAGERADDELKLPNDRVDDLEPDEDQSADVTGGRQVYQWWQKVEGGGGG